ncbi:Cdc6/Cdc18 family protein [Methanosphaera cuniculi]|uniref:ORC1-type DNA replication protein n=1 Tax=Methanosphaera cuniculi TaxID=1077256 RepID=A0A2A2HEX5_9EURY|nr:orc1/cdc6 family replication initiation protein [Methanosphaera cuniculi]PAV07947.1 cell division control protein Cdc6 [Methanosphaera cuniculi]PWL08842.1 cell division control protein 6 [Methanosphaera cuniculi]
MNIFQKLDEKETIFKTKEYLDHRFIPETLPHRNEQIESIAKYWVEALNNITPPDITLYGKTGTGKTSATLYAKKQLEEIASERNLNIRIEYLRCTDFNTEYQILAQLCQKLGKPVPFRGWTKAEVVNTFRSLFTKNVLGKDMILIVILDEIDVVLKNDGDSILYTLTRTDNVAITSISNYVDFKKFIKPKVKSSLRDREIVFPPYNAAQLQDILKERSQLSFKEGVISSGVLSYCAALAAKEEGDARYALDLLKTSGEIADEIGASEVNRNFVEEAKDRIEHNKIYDVIVTLPIQQQRVLETIKDLTEKKKEITSGKLYESYQKLAKSDAVSYRRLFDFVNELEMLGLISTNTISRGRGRGRTNIITLQCDTDLIDKALQFKT